MLTNQQHIEAHRVMTGLLNASGLGKLHEGDPGAEEWKAAAKWLRENQPPVEAYLEDITRICRAHAA